MLWTTVFKLCLKLMKTTREEILIKGISKKKFLLQTTKTETCFGEALNSQYSRPSASKLSMISQPFKRVPSRSGGPGEDGWNSFPQKELHGTGVDCNDAMCGHCSGFGLSDVTCRMPFPLGYVWWHNSILFIISFVFMYLPFCILEPDLYLPVIGCKIHLQVKQLRMEVVFSQYHVYHLRYFLFCFCYHFHALLYITPKEHM